MEKIDEFYKSKDCDSFPHVEKLGEERAPVKAKKFVVEGSKKGRPKKR